jgi:hypothetical protein
VTPSRAGERRQRRSNSNLTEEAKRAAAAEIAHRVGGDPELTKPFAQMPQSPKRAGRRRSRPDPEETGEAPAVEEPSNTQLQDRPPDTDPHGLTAEQQRRMSRTEEMDQWPTQSLIDGKELDGTSGGFDSGKTRVGAQAYVESSRRVLEPPANELRASQAVRVIVWRGPDGVHVAPAGTKVAAITVEAILVGLDPNADLATWLKG